ncbi:hypothetical protein DFAR_3900006 [Desulfarculales bacterium]
MMKAITEVPYIKLEHDHRSLEDLPQGRFPREYADKLFKHSAFNVFVSPAHRATTATWPGRRLYFPADGC